ncbi:MAG TPA: YidC/Oxa1 family membrane protein insertase [Candidatus Saccharimonadales bacterium]|nr:YidC/Oxa1 family membrane protein insertase [Candidatus Saccharimonadales bacterium]
MFTTLIVQPIFNVLVFIYAMLPGHNFGLALILFTIIIRLLMWPLVKKQLHQVKVMRKIQPELRKIKAATKGDRQKESVMTMALYKEYGVNPFGSIGLTLLQLPILLGLYSGLNKLVHDQHAIFSFAYPFLQNFSWMQHISHNIHAFDATLFGVVDLTRSAVGAHGLYWPALIIVTGSAIVQFFQSKQLTPTDKEARKLRDILKGAGDGKQADQSEVNAAISRTTIYFLPAMIFLFTINIASALSLYWLVGGLVAFIQQSIILREDKEELEAVTDGKDTKKKSAKTAIEAEIVSEPKPAAKTKKKGSSQNRKKRRK